MTQKECATTAIFSKCREKILLVKRRDVPIWVLPGGGIDNNETPEQAAKREALEETGTKIKIIRKVAEYSPINKLTSETHLYECSIEKGTLSTGDETQDIAFFELDKLPKPFFYVHKTWLQDTLKNEKEIIRKPLADLTYWALLRYFCKHPIHVMRYALSRMGLPINS